MDEIEYLKREADCRMDALERGIKLLQLELPITALENMKDDLRSMERLRTERKRNVKV